MNLSQCLKQPLGGLHPRTVKLFMFQLFSRTWAIHHTISRFNNILLFSISAYRFITIPGATSGGFTPSNGETVHVPTFLKTLALHHMISRINNNVFLHFSILIYLNTWSNVLVVYTLEQWNFSCSNFSEDFPIATGAEFCTAMSSHKICSSVKLASSNLLTSVTFIICYFQSRVVHK